jgi:hypothetical protein
MPNDFVDIEEPEYDDEDEDIDACGYSIGYNIEENEMRIRFHSHLHGVLSSLTVKADEAYDFAQRILSAYDKLEGLDSK